MSVFKKVEHTVDLSTPVECKEITRMWGFTPDGDKEQEKLKSEGWQLSGMLLDDLRLEIHDVYLRNI